jgi:phosphonate transport system substrate-binding protein
MGLGSHSDRLVFASYLAPSLRGLYEFVAGECGGGPLVDGRDWRDLATGDIDAAFVCSPPMIWLGGAVEAIAAPVLIDARFNGQPLYTSEVIVHRDSSFRSLADLRGARWAYNEPSSWSGYWVVLARVGDWSYFSEVVAAGYHAEALRLVAAGVVDGAAIDCQVLAVGLRDHPELLERIRIVESLGPAPIQPLVVRSTLDPKLKDELRARLAVLSSPVLERFFVDRFAPPPDYSGVAAIVAGGAARASKA